MFVKKLLSAALVTSSVFATGQAVAAASVTLNPSGDNGLGALGVLGPEGPFVATGGSLLLGSAAVPNVLTIGASAGVAAFTEAGRIFLDRFSNDAVPIPPFLPASTTGLGTSYSLYVDFTLSGVGAWGVGPFANAYQASTAGLTFTGTLYGDDAGANGPVVLGTLSLVNTTTSFAVALTQFPPVPLGSGTANTVFSGTMDFAPAAGTTGVGGFFQAPTPFAIDINLGAVGGNNGNTVYNVSAGGVVTITTPVAGSPSTGNFTFLHKVPEPGALSLVGLALVGAAVASRRKAKQVVAA